MFACELKEKRFPLLAILLALAIAPFCAIQPCAHPCCGAPASQCPAAHPQHAMTCKSSASALAPVETPRLLMPGTPARIAADASSLPAPAVAFWRPSAPPASSPSPPLRI
jgi:hypothetical protein